MPELGDKHTCADCETKYYDLGRPDATCPKCGSANRVDDEIAVAPPRAPRPRPQPKPAAPVEDAPDEDAPDEDAPGEDAPGEENGENADDEELDLGNEDEIETGEEE